MQRSLLAKCHRHSTWRDTEEGTEGRGEKLKQNGKIKSDIEKKRHFVLFQIYTHTYTYTINAYRHIQCLLEIWGNIPMFIEMWENISMFIRDMGEHTNVVGAEGAIAESASRAEGEIFAIRRFIGLDQCEELVVIPTIR